MIDIENLVEHAQLATAFLKELANEKRLMICCCLGESELSVSQLNKMIPLSQSALSQHLARMRDAGLLKTRRESQTIHYRLADDNILKIIVVLKSIYCPD